MDTYKLKLLACFFMLVDHIFYVFNPNLPYISFIGRLAFPLFAFLISEGFTHTKDVYAYMKRLLIFCLISYIPYMLAFNAPLFGQINIFMTLFLGLLALYAYDNIKDKFIRILVILLIAKTCEMMGSEYGIYGILTIVFFRVFKDNFTKLVFSMIGLYLINIIYFNFDTIKNIISFGTIPAFNDFMYFGQIYSLLALIFIKFYNGKKGKNIKYFFYAFYPGHLLLLFLIKKFLYV